MHLMHVKTFLLLPISISAPPHSGRTHPTYSSHIITVRLPNSFLVCQRKSHISSPSPTAHISSPPLTYAPQNLVVNSSLHFISKAGVLQTLISKTPLPPISPNASVLAVDSSLSTTESKRWVGQEKKLKMRRGRNGERRNVIENGPGPWSTGGNQGGSRIELVLVP